MIDTGGATAAVAPWVTDRYDRAHNSCAGVFDTFIRDIDFSPDGSYFVVSRHRRLRRRRRQPARMCDTVTRWETNSTGNDPTWSTTPAATRRTASPSPAAPIYVGGHMRWENNPFQGDQAGPGAVPREGIAALDPVNGLPLSWNPGRTRGVGAQALFATSQGLWVGSDTNADRREDPRPDRVHAARRRDSHPDRARPPPCPTTCSSPSAPPAPAATCSTGSTRPGRPLQAADGGPDWTHRRRLRQRRQHRRLGHHRAPRRHRPRQHPGRDLRRRALGPAGLELPGPGGRARHGPALLRQPVRRDLAGRPARLQRRSSTAATVLSNFDIVAAAGNKTGTMRSFTITSDGDGVDIDFRAVTENPLINGIEIIDNDAAAGGSTTGRPPASRRSTPPARRPARPAPRTRRSTGRPSAARSCSTGRSTTA